MPSGERSPIAPWASLILATLVVGYALLFTANPISQSHADLRRNQLTCMVMIGVLGLVSWLWMLRTKSVSHSGRRLEALVLLLPAYALFQVIPLPLWLVRILSPARAGLADNAAPFLPPSGWTTISVAPTATVYHFLLLSACAVLFLVIWAVSSRVTDRPWLPILPLVILGVLEGIVGLLQASGGMAPTGATGTYSIRNHFAGFLGMVMPCSVVMGLAALRQPGGRHRYGPSRTGDVLLASCGFGAAALMLGAVMASLSRMGSVAAMAALIFVILAWFARGRSKRQIIIVIVAVAILAPALVLFLPSRGLLERFAVTETEERTSVWWDTRKLIAAYPVFGCGLGGYESAFVQFKTSHPEKYQDYAHNDYLQYLSELGVVGYALSALPLALIVMRLWKRSRQPMREDTGWVTLACAGAGVAIGLHSAADFNLYIPPNMLVLAWLLGVAASAGAPRGGRSRELA